MALKYTFVKSAGLCLLMAGAQAQTKVWEKTFGSDLSDQLTSALAVPSGGYLLGGTSGSKAGGDKTDESKGGDDYWIVKIDANGSKVWDKTFGGSGTDALVSMLATADGGFLLCGTSSSPVSGDKSEASKGFSDYWIIKIDAGGKKVWDKTFGGSSYETFGGIAAAPGGRYLIAGTSRSGDSGDKSETSKGNDDFWVLTIDADGKKIWDKSFGSADFEDLRAIAAAPEGGYLLGGSSTALTISGDKTEAGKGDRDYWAVKIDADGKKVWDKTFGGDKGDAFRATVAAPGGGYILGGYSASGINGDKSEAGKGLDDYWILKIDGTGQKLWDKTFGGAKGDFLNAITLAPSGYVLGGDSDTDLSGDKSEAGKGQNDYWGIRINADGKKIKDIAFGGTFIERMTAVLAAPGGGFLLCGRSQSGISGDKSEASKGGYDYWAVRVKEEMLASDLPDLSNSVSIYPNPGSGVFNIGVKGLPGVYQVEVFDLQGRSVLKTSLNTDGGQLDLTGQEKGLYLLKLANASGQAVFRLIKE